MFEELQALTAPEPKRRDVAAAVLGDLLRNAALDVSSTRLIVGRLVSLAVDDPVSMVRESALNSSSEALDHHRLPLDIVRPLAAAMPTMERELLAHALYISGATHDPRARPLIEPFLVHPDADVREEAERAAAEIIAARDRRTGQAGQ
ncbi:hypothetical protein ABZ330_03950 [Streptomyces sp. NPDC006172]|uniref:hypothetical protein n=1 Tax=Streptomyces sp. NPDC006172 TaxID=3154470 RepID=UPI0033D95E22